MPRTKVFGSVEQDLQPMRPAFTPEARENQMISLAVDLAEKQLRDGSASSQVITHFLKLATNKEKLEQDVLKLQAELLDAKTKSVRSGQKSEELYSKALEAMRSYSGNNNDEEEGYETIDEQY